MKFSFWLAFSVSFLLLFCAGFFLSGFYFLPLEQSLLKKTIKLDSLLYSKQLDRKLNFLIKEAQKIEYQKQISPRSPFFVFAISKPFAVYVDEQLIPSPDKKNILAELSKLTSSPALSEGFQLKKLKTFKNNQEFVIFVKAFDKNKRWLVFLKDNKSFFKLSSPTIKDKKFQSKEFFAVNTQGQVFFRDKGFKFFKKLSSKPSVWKSLKELSKNQSLKGRYLKPSKKTGSNEMYYLQKWDEGGLFLITKINFFSSILLSESFYWIICFSLLAGFFILFIWLCFKFFSCVSAYQFLKMAFLSFTKTGVFPPTSNSKNPLLYFYNNRQVFLKDKNKEDPNNKKSESISLNLREIIKQELEKLKSKFPRMLVKEEYNFDVKVFGFEKFLRVIIRELLLNALEAMGGSREAKIDISTKEEGDHFILSVRDYGTGINNKDYKKPFQMYYSTKSQVGSGLNLVQSIIQANAGSIEMLAPEGEGLEVCVTLPLNCFLRNHFEKQEVLKK